jgi:hypothetical protein
MSLALLDTGVGFSVGFSQNIGSIAASAGQRKTLQLPRFL